MTSRNPDQQASTLHSFRSGVALRAGAKIESERTDVYGAVVLTLNDIAFNFARRVYHAGISHVRVGRLAGVPTLIIS